MGGGGWRLRLPCFHHDRAGSFRKYFARTNTDHPSTSRDKKKEGEKKSRI